MDLRGRVSNIKAFVGKGGKQFFRADFEATDCEFACGLAGSALDGVQEGHYAVAVASMALRSTEWNGKVVVGIEAKATRLQGQPLLREVA
jgi:hypothetical protein